MTDAVPLPLPLPLPLDHSLQLVSETAVEHYWFGADGLVVATLGTQGGPLCAPVFQYRVLSGDSIELFNQDGTIATWTGIQVDAGSVRVECAGKTKTFRLDR